jgi:hypothetical protein
VSAWGTGERSAETSPCWPAGDSGSRVKLGSWCVGELLLILLILLDFQGSNMCKLISICMVI